MYDRWFTIALLVLGFGASVGKAEITKIAYNFRRDVRLHNCAVADKRSNDEYYGDFPYVINHSLNCEKDHL